MSRYLRCTSCKIVVDTNTNLMVVAGITTIGAEKRAQELRDAIMVADPFLCKACEFVGEHTPASTPPDPSTYSKLNR